MTVKRIAFTPGEPAGIGPDLAVQIAQRPLGCELVVFADPELLRERAEQLKLPLRVVEVTLESPPQARKTSEIAVYPFTLGYHSTPGETDTRSANYLLETIKSATMACMAGQCDALVTGPVNKAIINDAGHPFSGHTEYIADLTDGYPVMMLATASLRVALATTHLPLADVPASITRELLEKVLRITHHDLHKRFDCADPRILVCGLNPHAGEGGHLGREEIETISPVIEKLKREGLSITGPLPADTLFTAKHLKNADAVLAMYHDQGLPVLKFSGFGKAVNITLGLPIVRTSVDHGTALDLAGSGKADCSSLLEAIKQAIQMK